MITSLPSNVQEILDWSWSSFEPYAQELQIHSLTAGNVEQWLAAWSHLASTIHEMQQRLEVARSCDTADETAERRYNNFLDKVYPYTQASDQRLKEKLLASGLEPPGFKIPLLKMRTEVALFRAANLPLLSEERKLVAAYEKIIGAQTVTWQGQELTLSQLRPVYQEPDRSVREHAWRLAASRQLADRDEINALWVKFLDLRSRMAKNAGYANYRDFRWQQLLRFDYTSKACVWFQDAIAEIVVPAAHRIYEKRRQTLDMAALRPWDLNVDPLNHPPLRPFKHVSILIDKARGIFQRVNPQLGAYFHIMYSEDLLDLDNRKGKAPGGFCTAFFVAKRPFIFMNAVGLQDDVITLLHEGGHAFHVFECSHLPYLQQMDVPLEFAEVASMSMELLAGPYLTLDKGGFYSDADIARARKEHLEDIIMFWPYMAVVDAFQHWVYEHLEEAKEPARCDACWADLWQRFMPGMDWSGLKHEMMTGWQNRSHIFTDPFYYVEYGVAQLGALQVWQNALANRTQAVNNYRKALSLGGTATLPKLYNAAGGNFILAQPDSKRLKQAVSFIETSLQKIEHGS
jgi:oligoendopeptidase F